MDGSREPFGRLRGARGGALPPLSRWGSITLLAFLLLGLGNGGVVVAEQWVPSGLDRRTRGLLAVLDGWC